MTSELTKALCAFHQQVGTIHKDAKAQYGKYADLAGVLSTVLPALSKNGLCISQTFDADKNLITTLTHVSGEERVSVMPMIVVPGRNELHSFGASVTYQRRYAICSMLCLVADIDTDGNPEEPTPKAATKAPKRAPNAATAPAKEPEPAATPADAPEPQDQPISEDERKLCIQLIKDMSTADRNSLIKAFKEHFSLPDDALITQYITTTAARDFIQSQLA